MPMSFDHTHALWSDRALELIRPVGTDWRTNFERISFDRIQEGLSAASTEYAAGKLDRGWGYLLQAATTIARFEGKQSAKARATPEAQITALNGERGGRGGRAKGANAKKLREMVADALLESYKRKKWIKVTEYEFAYQEVISKMGVEISNYNRNLIQKMEKIKAVLPKHLR